LEIFGVAVYVAAPPEFEQLLDKLTRDTERLVRILQARESTDGSRYLHWDKMRRLEPPHDLTHEEWWLALKWRRQNSLRPLPLADADGNSFTYSQPDAVLRLLRHVDQRCSGEIAMPEVVTKDDQARHHYLVNSLMEEAIRSSQLEGATTSRGVAKELLRSGREPTDRSERMILNNYRALQYMREAGPSLDANTVLELHRILTEGTLDDPGDAGRLQTAGDVRVAVFDRETQALLHKPPPASQLPGRLDALCEFANEPDDSEPFIHPVVRAILLHFWLAYDHPFEDGNGRTARALFYWYMRTRGYWLVEYLSVSRILADAPSKYGRAFLETETDGGDTTYFILYQLQVIERAIAELHRYLGRKAKEIRDVERLVRAGSGRLNHRQLALISHAIRNPDHVYTFQTHSAGHTVTHETARNDILPLVERGFFERHRIGRRHSFTPHPRLADRLKKAL
jgi:Fic family protein